ncbi:TolC family protein [Flavobacterium sp.]|jgi:outer membrane protein TolC|uniref:TolC family protein n=1 Tax=Flavobacterium sp. TaxID=239 RepID=UPI0037C000C9
MRSTFKIIFLILYSFQAKAQETISFKSIDEVLVYAEKNASVFKISNEQLAFAKYQTLISKINIFNPRGNASASATDNLQLPSNYLPAEIFGGVPGTFKETQFGQQYISAINIIPQIDLINIQSWQIIKASKINENLSIRTQLLIKKNLFENIAMTYYTIVSIQKQIKILDANYVNNKKIEDVVTNKNKEGLARQQDVNQATVNLLQIEDKKSQLTTTLLQQNNALKVLCDIDFNTNLSINYSESKTEKSITIDVNNKLLSQQSNLQKDLINQELKSYKSSFYPTLSAVGNWTYQDNSNIGFFNANSNTFQSSYIGLRLNYLLPEASKYLQKRTLKINLNIAQENAKHNQLQEKNANEQLKVDYQKTLDSYTISEKILILKTDTYNKNLEIYQQDLVSIDNLLISFNDKLNAELNTVVNQVNTDYLKTKININNTIQ